MPVSSLMLLPVMPCEVQAGLGALSSASGLPTHANWSAGMHSKLAASARILARRQWLTMLGGMSEIVVSFDCFGEFWLPVSLRVVDLKVSLAQEILVAGITELYVGTQRLDDHHVVGLAPLVAGCHLTVTPAASPVGLGQSDSPWQLVGLHDSSIVSVPVAGARREFLAGPLAAVAITNRRSRLTLRTNAGWVLLSPKISRFGRSGVCALRFRTVRAGTIVSAQHRDTGIVHTFAVRGPEQPKASVSQRLRRIPASRWIPAGISAIVAVAFALLLNKPMFLLLGLSLPLIVLGTALVGQESVPAGAGGVPSPSRQALGPQPTSPSPHRDLPGPQGSSLDRHDQVPVRWNHCPGLSGRSPVLSPEVTQIVGPHPLDLFDFPATPVDQPVCLVGPRALVVPFARALVLGRSGTHLTVPPVTDLETLGAEDWMRWLPTGSLGTRQILMVPDQRLVPSWCHHSAVVTAAGVTWYGNGTVVGASYYYGLSPAKAELLAREFRQHNPTISSGHTVASAPPGVKDLSRSDPDRNGSGNSADSLPTRAILPDGVTHPAALLSSQNTVPPTLQTLSESSALETHSSLSVPLGVGGGGRAIDFDLVTDGPHALVAGTTGAGKSELLQTLVLGLAARYSPAQVAIALVDYKGGSGFSHCKDLPHVVGMVTDLDPGSARRAIAGLAIQLKDRERLFADHAVSSFTDFHVATGGEVTLPRIVIVVDELRAMLEDEPDFVPALVRMAAQGRSLGIHLVLATQRPNGAITAEMRANLNTRLCLRVATVQDSLEVLDATMAAQIPAHLAGRAYCKIGGAEALAFQSFYAAQSPNDLSVIQAGRAPDTGALIRPVPPTPVLSPLLSRVTTITSHWAHIPPPQPLWAPALPNLVTLDSAAPLDTSLTPIGLGEMAGQQISVPVGVHLGSVTAPSQDHNSELRGNLAILGPARAGHSTTLATLMKGALAAGLHIHAIGLVTPPVASSAQSPPEQSQGVPAPSPQGLPPGVGTFAKHHEVLRITALLRALLEHPLPTPTVLMIDDLTRLRATLEGHLQGRSWDLLTELLRSAAHLNLTIVMTSTAGLPSSLAPLFRQRLVFLTGAPHEDQFHGVPAPWAGTGQTPGRGVLLGVRSPVLVQVATDIAGWAADAWRHTASSALCVPTLPTSIQLPSTQLGIAFQTSSGAPQTTALKTLDVPLSGHWLIAGTAGAGRTTAAFRFAAAHHQNGSLLGFFSPATTDLSSFQPHPHIPTYRMEQLPQLAQELVEYNTHTVSDTTRLGSVRGNRRAQNLGYSGPGTIVLDDVDDMMQRNPQLVQRAVDSIIGAGHQIIATLSTGHLSQPRVLPTQLLGGSNGIILGPSQRQHLVFLGQTIEEFTELSHLSPAGTRPGRGVLVCGGQILPIQVAAGPG